MKTLLLTITATLLIGSQAHARPGGWLVDILKGPNTVVYNNYPQQYYQQPVYYYQQPQPVYYYQPRPTYYYSEPVYRPMQPYQQHYRHCR